LKERDMLLIGGGIVALYFLWEVAQSAKQAACYASQAQQQLQPGNIASGIICGVEQKLKCLF